MLQLCPLFSESVCGRWAGTALTCSGLYYVRGVPQAHEVELVESPGLLVRRFHRVPPPLVDHFVSRVSVCKLHTADVRVYECVARGSTRQI